MTLGNTYLPISILITCRIPIGLAHRDQLTPVVILMRSNLKCIFVMHLVHSQKQTFEALL